MFKITYTRSEDPEVTESTVNIDGQYRLSVSDSSLFFASCSSNSLLSNPRGYGIKNYTFDKDMVNYFESGYSTNDALQYEYVSDFLQENKYFTVSSFFCYIRPIEV